MDADDIDRLTLVLVNMMGDIAIDRDENRTDLRRAIIARLVGWEAYLCNTPDEAHDMLVDLNTAAQIENTRRAMMDRGPLN